MISSRSSTDVPVELNRTLRNRLGALRSAWPLPRTAAWLTYLGVLVFIGMAGGWSVRLCSDEYRFYLPAIRQFERALPSILLADYDFPGPPVALVLQAIVYKLARESTLAIRFLSTLVAIFAAAVTERIYVRASPSRRTSLALLMTACFPFLLSTTFLIRQHAMTVAGLALGYYLWASPASHLTLLRSFGACLALALATLSNQMAVPFCALLAVWALRFSPTPEAPPARLRLLRVLAPAIPLAILATLMLRWRGAEPPSFRHSNPTDAGVGGVHPAQFLVGLMSLGVWVFPALRHPRRSWGVALALWLPASYLVQRSQMYLSSQDFEHSLSGPISTLIRHIGGSYAWMEPLVAGIPISFGAALLLERDVETAWIVRGYAALYLAMMSLTPYFFERYYLLLVVPLYWLLGKRIVLDRSFSPAAAAQPLIFLAGVAYTLSKLSELTF